MKKVWLMGKVRDLDPNNLKVFEDVSTMILPTSTDETLKEDLRQLRCLKESSHFTGNSLSQRNINLTSQMAFLWKCGG